LSKLARSLSLVFGVVILVVLTGCRGGVPSSTSSTSALRSPLVDANVCGVMSTERLQDILGYRLYWYQYWTGEQLSKDRGTYDPGYYCHLASDGDPYGSIDLSYGSNDVSTYSDLGSDLRFDDIPSRFPDAFTVTLAGRDGVGWGWFTGLAYHVAWRYPTGECLFCRIVVEDRSPDYRERDSFGVLLSEFVDDIPVQASRQPGTSVEKGAPY